MPIINANMGNQGGFHFSPVKMEKLKASAYTVGGIAQDWTGSVEPFADHLEQMLVKCHASCAKNPRKDNMLLRVTQFNSMLPGDIREVHGFDPVLSIDTTLYRQSTKPDGWTPLFKAWLDAVRAIKQQGRILLDDGRNCNGILFGITDGENNWATEVTPEMVAEEIASIRQEEALESFVSILIGINVKKPSVKAALMDFQKRANITHYLPYDDVTENGLAKLGGWISQSISSSSQAVGTGGPSKAVAPGASLTI